VRGIGRYARAILRLLLERDDVELTLLLPGPMPFVHRTALARALGSRRFRVRSRARGVDLVWHPANGTFFDSTAPNVATIHDAIAFTQPNPDLAKREREQAPILRSARTAVRVIADSAFARDDLNGVLGIPLERIVPIHLGVDAGFCPGTPAPLPAGLEPGRYVLFVGPIGEPRKNFDVLYAAFKGAWPADGPALAIVGPQAPNDPKIVAIPSVDDPGLCALYRGAIALAIPSYHEAFGLPLLEAMACGTPAIAARASALPEVGGDAPYYVAAGDGAGWKQALLAVAGSAPLRERMRAAGLHRAQDFDWQHVADRHLALFREVAAA